MPRPTKYNKETADLICQTLRQGNTKRVAYLTGGIGETTFYEWCEKYPAFAEDVEKAEAAAEQRHVVNISTHSADNWQASAWWLERRRHDDWRKRETTTLEGNPAAPLTVIRKVYADDDAE